MRDAFRRLMAILETAEPFLDDAKCERTIRFVTAEATECNDVAPGEQHRAPIEQALRELEQGRTAREVGGALTERFDEVDQ